MYMGMQVEAWFERQNNNIYELPTLKWKYYNEVKESWNFMLIYNNVS